MVEYAYNAWGKPLYTSGSLASTLGVLNPFRYRGYIYDEETGYYYLRSRYYYPNRCRFINADILYKGNLYSYCKNMPIIGIDKDGFAVVCCFDENGFETSFMSYATMGCSGGGGTAAGYIGSIYATSKPEDVSLLFALRKTAYALYKRMSFELGVGVGMAGEIDAMIANVGGGIRFDIFNFSFSDNGCFLGEKAEISMSCSVGIKDVDNCSVGGSITGTRMHSYTGCDASHALFDYLFCPHTERSSDTGKSVNLGSSTYFVFGATFNLSLDIDGLWNELLDIWT